MSVINKVEQVFVRLYARFPRMPSTHRSWLVDNAWRLDIIGAILSVYSIFVLTPLIVTALVLTPSVNVIAPMVAYADRSPSLAWVALLLAAAVFFTIAVILTIAVGPVYHKEKRGWDLMFRSYLLTIVLGIVTSLMFPSPVELIALALIFVIAGYLLIEVRSSFKHGVKKPVKVKA